MKPLKPFGDDGRECFWAPDGKHEYTAAAVCAHCGAPSLGPFSPADAQRQREAK